jgi:chorismate synthase
LPQFKNGLFQNRTTGAPLTILFENKNTRGGDYQKQRAIPRPGHADMVAHQKFGGYEDYRGGGHFSGRLTVCLVGAGVVAKRILQVVSGGAIQVQATIDEIGGEKDLDAGLAKAIEAKDSVGGMISCRVTGLPAGLGEPFWDSVESLLSHAVFAIPAVRGIEFGTGFAAARMYGSQHNDAIENIKGKTATNHAGGIVGGITTGNDLNFRIAIKPTSSTPKEQVTLNWETGEMETFSVKGRHDLCIALRVPPVLEAVAAIVLADLMMVTNEVPRVVNEPIYHLTTQHAWQQAQQSGAYEVPGWQQEGFIHCSDAHQVAGVRQRYFAGVEYQVLLTIDPRRLNARLVYEPGLQGTDYFPHVFGPINLDAVTATQLLD